MEHYSGCPCSEKIGDLKTFFPFIYCAIDTIDRVMALVQNAIDKRLTYENLKS